MQVKAGDKFRLRYSLPHGAFYAYKPTGGAYLEKGDVIVATGRADRHGEFPYANEAGHIMITDVVEPINDESDQLAALEQVLAILA